MTSWKELVNASLLGTDRHTGSVTSGWNDPAIVKLLSGLDPADCEGTLLRTAGVITAYQRAGTIASTKAGATPAPPLPVQSSRQCSPAAADMLAQMLGGVHQSLLPVWLQKVAARGETIPPRLLAHAMDHMRGQSELRKLALPVLGELGFSLAAQNPDWKVFGQSPELDSTWQTGSTIARREYLRNMRAADPAHARQLLEEALPTEPARSRADFLGTFEVGLSPDDEELLEKCLDDKSKEVRSVAADLLSRIPQSRLVARMTDRARACISIKKKLLRSPALEVVLPETVDAEAQRDGIDEKLNLGRKVGTKVTILYQYVRCVPPSVWEEAFHCSAEEFLDACERSDYSEALRMALVDAASRFRVERWVELFLRPGSKLFEALNGDQLNRLMTSLSPESQNRLLITCLPVDDKYAPSLLMLHTVPWSAELSSVVVRKLLRHLATTKNSAYLYSDVLRQAARYMHASVEQEAAALLSTALNNEGTDGNRWLEFLNSYQFRVRMEKEFET